MKDVYNDRLKGLTSPCSGGLNVIKEMTWTLGSCFDGSNNNWSGTFNCDSYSILFLCFSCDEVIKENLVAKYIITHRY